MLNGIRGRPQTYKGAEGSHNAFWFGRLARTGRGLSDGGLCQAISGLITREQPEPRRV